MNITIHDEHEEHEMSVGVVGARAFSPRGVRALGRGE